MTIDELLDRKYDRHTYNCAHYLIDAWRELVGSELTGLLPHNATTWSNRPLFSHRRAYSRLYVPSSPCVALFRHGRRCPHVGMYWGRRVLHMRETGPQYVSLDVALIGYAKVRFYKYDK